MIHIEPPRHHRVPPVPGDPHRAWVGTVECGHATSVPPPPLVAGDPPTATGRVALRRADPLLAGHRTGACRPADGVGDAARRESTGPTRAVAAVRGATGSRFATPIPRDAVGTARTPQDPTTEERLSRARREDRTRKGMEEHKA